MVQEKDRSEAVYKPRKKLLLDNFLGGIVWGLGSVIGATVVVAIIGFLITQTQQLPVIGNFIYSIVAEVERAAELNSLGQPPDSSS